jgi:hypothetical protein
MNLRDMLNQVLSQSAHIQKANFSNSQDVDDVQMISIANRTQQEIRDYYDWSALRRQYKVSILDGVERYKLPNDYRSFVPDSVWETDGSKQVEIPVPERRWFMYKFSTFSDGGVMRCRLYGDEIEVHDISPGEEFDLEYISKWAVGADDGSVKELFNNDNDTFLLDDQLLILGIQAHWAETKLLPQAQAWRMNFNAKLNEAIGRDSGGRTIGGSPTRSRYDRNSPYYPLYR